MKKSEKLLLTEIWSAAETLQKNQRGLTIGELISLIRKHLKMSQQALAKRAKVPQSNISRIESNILVPNTSTLRKILEAMECDLIISAVPRKPLEKIRENRAKEKARKKINYLQGTMGLEKQELDEKFLKEMIDEETKKLLDSKGSELWEEEL